MPEATETTSQAAETQAEAEHKSKAEGKSKKTAAAAPPASTISDDERKKIADEAVAKFKVDQEASEAERKRAEKEERDKERGEFKNLYEGEQKKHAETQAKLDALSLELKTERIHSRLRDHIQENQPEYLTAAKYMAKMLDIKSDTKDEDADAQIASVFDQYVKDNPRTKSNGTLAPVNKSEKTSISRAESNGVLARRDAILRSM